MLEQFKAMRAAERKAALESGEPRVLWGSTLFKLAKWGIVGYAAIVLIVIAVLGLASLIPALSIPAIALIVIKLLRRK